jgi:hypothetical protein
MWAAGRGRDASLLTWRSSGDGAAETAVHMLLAKLADYNCRTSSTLCPAIPLPFRLLTRLT